MKLCLEYIQIICIVTIKPFSHIFSNINHRLIDVSNNWQNIRKNLDDMIDLLSCLE